MFITVYLLSSQMKLINLEETSQSDHFELNQYFGGPHHPAIGLEGQSDYPVTDCGHTPGTSGFKSLM
jgi:hypothetical protein